MGSVAVHTYWSDFAGQAGLMRVWARSWRNRGFIPKLLTSRMFPVRDFRPARCYIANVKSIGWVIPTHVLNFNLNGKLQESKVVKYRQRGWETADLVWFETEDDYLSCGRRAC